MYDSEVEGYRVRGDLQRHPDYGAKQQIGDSKDPKGSECITKQSFMYLGFFCFTESPGQMAHMLCFSGAKANKRLKKPRVLIQTLKSRVHITSYCRCPKIPFYLLALGRAMRGTIPGTK
ncbi:hypothetical protein T265_07114 [Opisthorchis viverrini]|uniref:Uncharacterized protein n=1 Tax=Opisthorchis viverrini TaxID=6198 RepID=A0A075ACG5_OPIVI|nr:hypothetical protein T265_07114 [Opisthorchis viverrini]KER25434.1 hypothetical protein T265_07114 [Opisthorchis viverrini]